MSPCGPVMVTADSPLYAALQVTQPGISPSYDINVSPEPLNLLLHRAAAADGPPSLWPAHWNINPDLDQVNKWWIYYKKEDIGYLNHDGKFRLILNQSTVDVIWSHFSGFMNV